MAASSDQNFDRKRVLRALKVLGFYQVKGNATGHDIFSNGCGTTCQVVVRNRDVGINQISSLGLELEKKGIIKKRAFVQMIRTGVHT